MVTKNWSVKLKRRDYATATVLVSAETEQEARIAALEKITDDPGILIQMHGEVTFGVIKELS